MTPLETLEQMLRRRLVPSPDSVAETSVLVRLNRVRQTFSPPRGRFSDARIAQGIMAFRIAGENTSYPDLRYACHGVARPMDWEGRILLADSRQLEQLLRAVLALTRWPRRFAACHRALHAAAASIAAELSEESAGDPRQKGASRLLRFIEETRCLLVAAHDA